MKSALLDLVSLLLGPLVLAKPGLLDQVQEEHAAELRKGNLAAHVADADEVRLFQDMEKHP